MTMTLSPHSLQLLPNAPRGVLNANGQPHIGRFAGQIDRIDWSQLAAPYARSRWWQYFHHKRWQYVALSSPEIFCGIAIVDVGWTNTAFVYVFDRALKKQVAGYSQDGIPGMTAHVGDAPRATSHFCFLSNRITYQTLSDGRGYQLHVCCGNLKIDAILDASLSAPPLLAIGPALGGSVHATQKSPGMPLSGEVLAGGKCYVLDGGIGSSDYSNGLLARETAWRWASAHSLQIGFNLQAGYFAAQENILWLDGQLIPLSHAHFDYDATNPLAPWHIYTSDGLLDVQFHPEGARCQNKNLLIATSRYIQPIGSFHGWVKAAPGAQARPLTNLVGVTEEHYSRW